MMAAIIVEGLAGREMIVNEHGERHFKRCFRLRFEKDATEDEAKEHLRKTFVGEGFPECQTARIYHIEVAGFGCHWTGEIWYTTDRAKLAERPDNIY